MSDPGTSVRIRIRRGARVRGRRRGAGQGRGSAPPWPCWGSTAQARAAGQSVLDLWDVLETFTWGPPDRPAHAAHPGPRGDHGRAPGPGRRPRALGRGRRSAASPIWPRAVLELPPTDALILRLDGALVVLRPSGTEPKLKAYLEVTEPVRARRPGRGPPPGRGPDDPSSAPPFRPCWPPPRRKSAEHEVGNELRASLKTGGWRLAGDAAARYRRDPGRAFAGERHRTLNECRPAVSIWPE